MGKGGRDEGLFGKVVGDLDHLLLLAGEGILDVSRGVLDRVRLGLARDVSGNRQIRHWVLVCLFWFLLRRGGQV